MHAPVTELPVASPERVPRLTCYTLDDFAPKLVPARPHRRWMDAFTDRHAYRCLPLAIANAYGWEVLCPVPVRLRWTGGPEIGDLAVEVLKPLPGGRTPDHLVRSNFSRGIATFHVGYLFRTDPGWDLLAGGPVNDAKDGVAPLAGLIETDWLPYPFTMNWRMTRPGEVVFEEDEPICSIVPVRTEAIVAVEPEIRRLRDDPELARQHEAFKADRDGFMRRWHAGDPAILKQAWQRRYFLGRHPDGTPASDHLQKLRLKPPVDRRPAPTAPPGRTSGGRSPAARVTFGSWSFVPLERTATAPARPRAPPGFDPVAAMSAPQTGRNHSGRARLDGEGRLTNRLGTRLVRSGAEAAGRDFLVLDDLLSGPDCALVTDAFEGLEGKLFRSGTIDPYWNDRFVWLADILAARPDAARVMMAAGRRAAEAVGAFYGLDRPVYSDLMQVVRWLPGMFMRWHADNAHPDGSAHAMAHRAFSGIAYLNDDYEGGELYLTALDVAVRPKRGMFVAFTGGFHHEHAVLRVESGAPRLTMPMFFGFDRARADPLLYPEGR